MTTLVLVHTPRGTTTDLVAQFPGLVFIQEHKVTAAKLNAAKAQLREHKREALLSPADETGAGVSAGVGLIMPIGYPAQQLKPGNKDSVNARGGGDCARGPCGLFAIRTIMAMQTCLGNAN